MKPGDYITRGDGDLHRVVQVSDDGLYITTYCIIGAFWIAAGEEDYAETYRYRLHTTKEDSEL